MKGLIPESGANDGMMAIADVAELIKHMKAGGTKPSLPHMLASLLFGVGLGATAMYWLDPRAPRVPARTASRPALQPAPLDRSRVSGQQHRVASPGLRPAPRPQAPASRPQGPAQMPGAGAMRSAGNGQPPPRLPGGPRPLI